jgi:hypothetical protein
MIARLSFSVTLWHTLVVGTIAVALALLVDYGKAAQADGVIRSHKTGATAHVAPEYATSFQAYVDDLENQGATVRFMEGYRRGTCSLEHQHPCDGGMALDVCQTGRGQVDPKCNLPSAKVMAQTAARHGLLEGGLWCDQDRGHAQVRVTAPACGASVEQTIAMMAKRNAKPAEPKLALAVTSDCMTESQARAKFPRSHLYWHGPDHCWDNNPSNQGRVAKTNFPIPAPRPNQVVKLDGIGSPGELIDVRNPDDFNELDAQAPDQARSVVLYPALIPGPGVDAAMLNPTPLTRGPFLDQDRVVRFEPWEKRFAGAR